MNIGILSQLKQNEITGINRVTVGTLSKLLEIDNENNYVFLGKNDWLPIKLPAIDILFSSIDRINLNIVSEMFKFDIVHSHSRPFYFNDKIKCAKIITIHDMIPLLFPEWNNNQRDYYNGPIRDTVKESDLVIAVSESTKKDIIEQFDVPEEKVKVVYSGLYSPSLLNNEECETKKYKGIRYILSVSAIGANKNQVGLIEAFYRYKSHNKDKELKLIIVGPIRQYQVIKEIASKYSDVNNSVIFTGFLRDSELTWLYKNCLAFVFVSFYEGFGLPILEAMSMGKAVVSSNTSSMPEIGGDACIYCNPYEIDSIEDSILQVLGDDEYRKTLEKSSLIQAEKFTYENTAKETIKIYSMFK